MPIELGSFSIGLLAGGAVVAGITHMFNKSRDSENRSVQRFNMLADDFRNSLIVTVSKMESGQCRHEVIKVDFSIHQESMLKFLHCLKGKVKIRFETDWNTYQQWYQEVCCRNTADRLWPPEGEDEYNKKKSIDPLDIINKLIAHTNPK